MTILRLFTGLLLLLAACQKKEQKVPPRSIYDQPVFAQVSLQAASDAERFATFKRDPFFNLLWENLTFEEGQAWLQKVETEYPLIAEKWDHFRSLDALGAPRTYVYKNAGVFSPATLRLIGIAADIQKKTGSLKEVRIVQIGAECGGLCKILHDLSPWKSYTLIDLPEQLALAKKCLGQLGIERVQFLTPEELGTAPAYDLVISDMGFSQFNHSYQKLFFDRILSPTPSGYLLGRTFPKHFGIIAWNGAELKKQFETWEKCTAWEMQEPAADRENFFIYWKR